MIYVVRFGITLTGLAIAFVTMQQVRPFWLGLLAACALFAVFALIADRVWRRMSAKAEQIAAPEGEPRNPNG